MRENDGRKLDHATLEALRIRAVKQIEAGEHPEDVARALGMARGTVFGWVAKYREGGLNALKAKPIPGKPPKLNGTHPPASPVRVDRRFRSAATVVRVRAVPN